MNDKSTASVPYLVAVSGGVDSVALLHILVNHMPSRRLIVAHFDHGIRSDALEDRQFVGRLAKMYGLQFVYAEGRLGADASEDRARQARYDFLQHARQQQEASHIVTAHHEDDLLETAIINMLRGTGRKGLSSLASRDELYRPLLRTPKTHVLAYAKRHGLQWREDSTNADPRYLRNHIRQTIMPRLTPQARQELRRLIDTAHVLNGSIDELLKDQLDANAWSDGLDRRWLRLLPDDVAGEVMAAWLRMVDGVVIDRKLIERAVAAARLLAPGKQVDINGRYILLITRDSVTVAERSDNKTQRIKEN